MNCRVMLFENSSQGSGMRLPAAVVAFCTLMSGAPVLAFECSPAEVGYIATFHVAPEREAEFERVVLELATRVHELEPGVRLYAPYRGAEPGVYYMLERYDDEAARRAHASAEQIRSLFPTLTALLREPLDVQPIASICP